MGSTASPPESPRSAPSPAADPAAAAAPDARESWGWTPLHRRGLAMLLVILLAALTVLYVRRPARLDDPIVLYRGTRVELETQLDPNTADFASLTRVPHLTEKLARAIIDYRDARRPTAAEGVVFQNLVDLDAVPGIGRKTLEELRPFLCFPGDATQTAPAPHGLTGPRRVPETPLESATSQPREVDP